MLSRESKRPTGVYRIGVQATFLVNQSSQIQLIIPTSDTISRVTKMKGEGRNGDGCGRSKRPMAIDEYREDGGNDNAYKRGKHRTMAEAFKCPISHNLPVDPVTASDVSTLHL